MLDVNLIRKNTDDVKAALAKKNVDPKLVDKFLKLDEEWRLKTATLDQLQAEQNKVSSEMAGGKSDHLLNRAQIIKKRIGEVKKDKEEVEKKREEILYLFPNLPFEEVPVGKDATANRVLREVGTKPHFDFNPKDYLEIGKKLGLIDISTASKVSGSRFGYLKGDAAILEFAIIQLAFKTLTDEKIVKKIADSIEKGYSAKTFVPVVPPVMIKPDVYIKMARLDPIQKEERYYLPADDLYLVGSAEHTLGPMHMEESLPEEELPLRYVGFSTCFRREAGSYGKDTKGIIRVHQFDKVEMESFTSPEDSTKEQNFFVAIQEYLMQSLELPYRVVFISTGDMGGPDARQIDIECWLPGQNEYRETHTADLMTDYQSRRLNTRIKRKTGKTELVHMNDATVFAIGRTIVSIIENYQTKKGTVKVPKVLQDYVGKKEIGA